MEKARDRSDEASDELPLHEISKTRVLAIIIVHAQVTKVSRRSTNPTRIKRLLSFKNTSASAAAKEHL